MCSSPFSFLHRICDPSAAHVVDVEMPALVQSTMSNETAVNSNVTSKTVVAPSKPPGKTFAHQDKLPHLPIPPLEDTCSRYLRALKALQSEEDHAATTKAVEDFLKNEGPRIQQKLIDWAKDKARYVIAPRLFPVSGSRNSDSYIEEFWYESYLSHSDPVVLALNPFFVLE